MTITYSLEGKRALVTGSRRGIGKAIALVLAKAGADVAVCDYVMEDGELVKVAKEIENMGRHCLAIRCDVSKKADVEEMYKAIDAFGSIDILVNNAGTAVKAWFLDISEEDWDRVMDVNVKGMYLCSQLAARRMIEAKNGGSIINIASIGGLEAGVMRPRTGATSAYVVSKGGVIMFTRMLARQIGPYNIRVNSLAPGLVKTRFGISNNNPTPWTIDQNELNYNNSLVPLGRMAELEEIADVALFLACDASRYINGATIVVDGGLIA